jgi:hypothetical protein
VSSSTSNSKDDAGGDEVWYGARIPFAAVVAVVCIILIEAVAIQRHILRLEDPISAAVSAKRARLTSGTQKDDIVVFGSSRIFSVKPKTVSNAWDGKARVTNYAWPDMGMQSYEAMFRAYTHYNPPPRFVLVDSRIELISMRQEHNSMLQLASNRVRAYRLIPAIPLLKYAADRRYGNLMWHRFEYLLTPPSAHYQRPIVDGLRSVAAGRGWPPVSSDYERITEAYQREGAFRMFEDRTVTPDEMATFEKSYGPFVCYDNREEVQAFDRFLTLANDSGTTVLMIGCPLTPVLKTKYDDVGATAAYEKLIAEWQQRHANFHALEPLAPVYPMDNFGDPGHVNVRGDQLFQEQYESSLRAYHLLHGNPVD